MVTKVTQKMIEASNTLVDAAVMPPSTDVPEPGMENTVVNSPSADNPAPMVVSVESSAGWRNVFRRDTGEPVAINMNMMAAQLAKRFPMHHATMAGELAFQQSDPGFRPTPGSLKCGLHADSPDREIFDKMGLPLCKKSNLNTTVDVRTHMQHRHSAEWEAIEEIKQEGIREEERLVRKTIIANTAPQQQPEVAVATPVAEPEVVPNYKDGQCPECDWKSDAAKAQSRKMSVERHLKTHG